MAMGEGAQANSRQPSPDSRRASPPALNTATNITLEKLPESNMHRSVMQNQSEQQLKAYAASFSSSNRQEIIDRLKSYQNPDWLGKDLDHASRRKENSPKLYHIPLKVDTSRIHRKDDIQSTKLLESTDLNTIDTPTELDHDSQEIDETFLEDLDRTENIDEHQFSPAQALPWYRTSPPTLPHSANASPSIDIPQATRTPARSRAPSFQSYSSSFILRPPTSPLAQQANHDEPEFSPMDLDNSPIKSNRRHTLPAHSLQALRSDLHPLTLAQAARQPPSSLQRERSFPFQTHHARRSYTGLPFPASPSPSTPAILRSRRSSYASDASPLQASMVGSYEESILRGRMSTTPSKPLDFVARIGALGHGDCKPKYPAHVSVGFPAVYYSWSIGNGGSITDEPSPYVGHIDLEHKLSTPATRERPRKRKATNTEDDDLDESSVKSREVHRKEKRRRRSRSPQGSLQSFGGCYRIPQQGQLQILISNPHKTAVKFFLVPYDLDGMQPGTKTFIRQRSYSTGPIVEKPVTSRSLSDSVIDTKQTKSNVKPVLRYLVQLNICCPAKDRFYLYKSIDVVFANRVPDDKEQLQVEILRPEPRYSPWRASKTESSASTPSKSSEFLSRSTSQPNGQFNINRLDAMDDLCKYPQMPSSSKHIELFNMGRSGKSPAPDDQTSLAFRGISPDIYTKLNRGESGYGGRPATPEPGQGLLAQRLRGLSSEKDSDSPGHASARGMDTE